MTAPSQDSLRVVIFGGTGRTGRQIAEQALQAGHSVVSVGRTATQETVCAGSEAFAADVLDPDAVKHVLHQADVAVIALSIPRKTASPFSSVVGNKTLHSLSMRCILEACVSENVGYIVKLSAQGVGDSAPRAGIGFRLLVRFSNLRHAFADHATADRLLSQSSVRWTIVRPPILSDNASQGPVRAGETLRTTTRTNVPRVDVAQFIVQCLRTEVWSNRCVTLLPATNAAP